MVLDVATGISIFDQLLKAIGLIRDSDKVAYARKKEAFAAILSAFSETKSYVAKRSSGAARDNNIELFLANKWYEAAIPVRDLDLGLAKVCFEKGGYWIQPSAWTDDEVKAKGIAIEQDEARIYHMIGI